MIATIRRLTVAALIVAATAAAAETPLPEFNGRWEGRGTDRDLPWQSTQATRCRVTVKADLTHMTSDTVCNGEAGLHKQIHLAVMFRGQQFTGQVEQTSSQPGVAPTRRAGAVSGSRVGDVADFVARFGAFSSARVVLKLTSATSFSMQVSSMGATLTDVTYHRPAAR